MQVKEKTTHAEGNEEAWICICGNTLTSDGFYPCDQDGKEMEPVKGWRDLYVCDRCGRIVNQHSLEVVGQKAIQ